MTKIISQLDSEGRFVGPVIADESPLEPGVYLIPAGAVDAVPPKEKQGFISVWDGENFVYSPIQIPEAEPESPALTPEQLWLRIRVKRDAVKAGGVNVGDKWFHTDDSSRIQHMALNMMGSSIPANLQWKTLDGTFVTMTQALAKQVFQAVATLDMIAFAKAEEHRAAMEASADPASYDFSAGWPQTYAETLVP